MHNLAIFMKVFREILDTYEKLLAKDPGCKLNGGKN
jgi:hypothetical protein